MPRGDFDWMPLYPDEEQIARAVLGPKRAKGWPKLAKYLEHRHGLPPIDELMGGRYWPAVKLCLDLYHGLADAGMTRSTIASDRVRLAPPKADGKENFESSPKSHRRGESP